MAENEQPDLLQLPTDQLLSEKGDEVPTPPVIDMAPVDATPEKKGLSKKQMAGMAMAGLALAAIAAGIAINANNKTKPEVIVYPTKTEQPSTTSNGSESTSTAETTANTDQYMDSMEQYKNMSVSDFEKLPRDERLKYAMYLVDQTTSRGNYDNMYGSTDYKLEYTPVSTENSGQEIEDNNIFIRQVASIQFVEADVSGQPFHPFDPIDGQKVLSAAFYNVGENKLVSKEYLRLKSIFEPMQKPSRITDISTVIKTTPLLTKELVSGGEKIQYKVVTFKTKPGETIYSRYIYKKFTSYDGSKKAVWMMDVDSTSLDEVNQTAF